MNLIYNLTNFFSPNSTTKQRPHIKFTFIIQTIYLFNLYLKAKQIFLIHSRKLCAVISIHPSKNKHKYNFVDNMYLFIYIYILKYKHQHFFHYYSSFLHTIKKFYGADIVFLTKF